MRSALVAMSCLTAASVGPGVATAAVETVPAAAVQFPSLVDTELRDADPAVLRVLELADHLARQGVRYRRLKSRRRLSAEKLSMTPKRLSCSEFVWALFSLAEHDMGPRPVSSRRLALEADPYPGALVRVTDGTILPGDVLAYADPATTMATPSSERAAAVVSHVVIVVSARQRIVVGSHGHESTEDGETPGVGFRRLDDWRHWSHGRVLMATFRLRPGGGANRD